MYCFTIDFIFHVAAKEEIKKDICTTTTHLITFLVLGWVHALASVHSSFFYPLVWAPSSCVTSVHVLCQMIFCVCVEACAWMCHLWVCMYEAPGGDVVWQTRMATFSCEPLRPHRDVPFHVRTLPMPAACWVKSPAEWAQMSGLCHVLECTVIKCDLAQTSTLHSG